MNKQQYMLFFIATSCVIIFAYILFVSITHTQSSNTIKVGILHSLTGTMAASEKNLVDATLFAIEQINQAGGVLDKVIQPIIANGKSDAAVFAQEAERLI